MKVMLLIKRVVVIFIIKVLNLLLFLFQWHTALFDAYEEESGVRPDAHIVRWWETLGTLKWGIMCITQASAHLNGMARSHELAAIGRRVCENEYDLLELLTLENS